MLQVKNLTITHKKDFRVLLKDFSCTFNYGDKAVIIGEEGDGKSTLLRWIYDEMLIETYAKGEGERVLGGEKLAYLPQELSEEHKVISVYEFFSMEPMFWEQTPKELALLARKMHMSGDFFYSEQRMGTLSGGEKVKAQMMRILMGKPTVLLLDEPSNDIDIATLQWLEQEILDWPYIVVFISHDETLIERTANMIIHIEQLKRKQECRYTVSKTSYESDKEERGLIFANQRQQALNDRREKKIRDEKYRKLQQKVENAQASVSRQNPHIGQLLKKKMHAVKSMERRFEREDANMTQMPEEETAIFFKLGNEEATIPAGKVILDFSLEELRTPDGQDTLARDIRLFIRGSQKVCIIGENGAGKTTLLKRIAEELLARKDIHAEYMPQNYEELLDMEKSPVDFLDRTGDKEERTRIRTYLGSLKYTADEMEHPIRELSGGQKAKVLLLKMSLSGANVLILDEPTRNFSPLSGPVLRGILAEFPGAIISISHDRKYIEEVCDTVYQLTEEGLVPAE
ncbi:MAG: ABC-F family ATP-binding cassette domain-containing protein [Lachnospiraceae bacterium]|nr:ABC-F family ATP-binding cassette domain-containing protein [Lachnospiraceae bacterium]